MCQLSLILDKVSANIKHTSAIRKFVAFIEIEIVLCGPLLGSTFHVSHSSVTGEMSRTHLTKHDYIIFSNFHDDAVYFHFFQFFQFSI